MACRLGNVGRRLAALVAQVPVRARRKEESYHVRMPFGRRQHQGSEAFRISKIDGCACLGKVLNDARLARFSRNQQGRVAIGSGPIDLLLRGDEGQCGGGLADFQRPQERRPALVVRNGGVCSPN